MVKKQIDVKIRACDIEVVLPSDESKACPQFQQKFNNMVC